VEEWDKVEFWTSVEAAQMLFMASIPGFAERKGCLLSLQQIKEGKVLKIRYTVENCYLV
jgi:hypothetical protein